MMRVHIQRSCVRMLFVALAANLFVVSAFAAEYELYPYAGATFLSDFRAHPDQIEKFTFATPGLFGVKGGISVTDHLQVEGNFGYINQFRIQNALNPSIHAYVYEAGATYNFVRLGKIYPYLAGAVGAMSLNVSNPDNPQTKDAVTYPVIVAPFSNGTPIPFTIRPLTVESGDTFFSFSYGAGVKGERLWGPLGFRFELRGRTTPNFYGDSINALEPTGGLLFSWGER